MNVERASTSTSMPKGKKGKKKKPSTKGPRVGPTPKIGKSKGKEEGWQGQRNLFPMQVTWPLEEGLHGLHSYEGPRYD